MDKQKIDLDKLYKERFQSFEMKPSSTAATSMLKKLKLAKTISMLKWIAGAVLIATTAVTITLLSFNTDKTESLNENKQEFENSTELKTPSITSQKIEESENNTKKEINIKKEIEEKSTQIKNEIITEHPQKIMLEEAKNNESNSIKENEITSEKTIETVSIQEVTKSFEFVSREETIIKKLSGKSEFLEIRETPVSFAKAGLELNSPNRFLDLENEKTPKHQQTKSIANSGSDANNKKSILLGGYVGLQFAPIIWQNNSDLVSPKLDTNYTYLLNHSPKLSYEFGWSFQLHHQKLPLFLQLGMDYQVLKEEVDFQLNHTFVDPALSYWSYDSSYIYPEILDTFYIIIDDDHFVIDSIFTIDTVLSNVDSLYHPVNSTEKKSKKQINSYRYIHIPLLLGYQFESRNKKWSYQIMAGPSVSINLKNEGFYYNNSGDFEEYSGKVIPSMVWNFYAAANINYRWKKWQIFAQPEFQYQLNESELNFQTTQRKYQFYKLKLGIRYQIF